MHPRRFEFRKDPPDVTAAYFADADPPAEGAETYSLYVLGENTHFYYVDNNDGTFWFLNGNQDPHFTAREDVERAVAEAFGAFCIINMDLVAELLVQMGHADTYVEMTGGNCATIYGPPSHEEEGWGTRYRFLAGPGTFDSPSSGFTDDFAIGPDDDGCGEVLRLKESSYADEVQIAKLIDSMLRVEDRAKELRVPSLCSHCQHPLVFRTDDSTDFACIVPGCFCYDATAAERYAVLQSLRPKCAEDREGRRCAFCNTEASLDDVWYQQGRNFACALCFTNRDLRWRRAE